MGRKTAVFAPLLVLATALLSATAFANGADGLKKRWDLGTVRRPVVVGDEGSQRASEMRLDCLQRMLETYFEDPDAIGDCHLGTVRCAYEECQPEVEKFHTECLVHEEISKILKAGRR
jgi:hypothetical protein